MEEQRMVVEDDEEVVEYNFTAYEVDLDYEFDADRFFNFFRPETPEEERRAEAWFDYAGTYPPSPFVARLVPNPSNYPKFKGVENMNLEESGSDTEIEQEITAADINSNDTRQDMGTSTVSQFGGWQKFQNPSQQLPSGLTFHNHMANNIESKTQSKKPSIPRISTLMKPTASQLAKQKNRPLHTDYSRTYAPFVEKMDKSSASTCAVENQAAKRQKLDGGLLKKVVDAAQPQQTSFVHKAPKRDGFLDGTTTHSKLLTNTIPREPDLKTAHRALRTRPKSSIEVDNVVSAAPSRFKALPLNRKILEAPSLLPKRSTPRLPNFQEFHLKTSERAMQYNSAVSTSNAPSHNPNMISHRYTANLTTECGNIEPARPDLMNASNPEGCESSHRFKALPLKKKEFNFPTEKRFNHNPPTELFNKLSLAPDPQPTAKPGSKLARPISISSKDSKENRWGYFQQGNEIKQPSKSKLPLLGENQHFATAEDKNGSHCHFWH